MTNSSYVLEEEELYRQKKYIYQINLLSRASVAKCWTSWSGSWINFSKHGLPCKAKALIFLKKWIN